MPLTKLKVRNAKAAAKPVKMTDGNGMPDLSTGSGALQTNITRVIRNSLQHHH